MFASALFALLSSALVVSAHPGHLETVDKALPGRWYHNSDHPVNKLFNRGTPPTDGVTYAEVGSPTWASAFPSATPDSSLMPQEWKDALATAVQNGKIPNIPVPSPVNGNPTYPTGANPNGADICSAYYKCRVDTDIWDAPDGHIGIGFDDGPYLGSGKLYDFLQANNQRSTHFMIGINILYNADLFLRAFNDLQGDIAVHTWTHRYMSTLSNEDLVAEFGWSMEIIKNSTGGRLPRYWRPPYGDMDNRVRAITKEIFGLEPILWNQDTEDWSLTTGGTTAQAINSSMTKWLTGSKTPGLIILEHELSNQSAQAFIDAYPLMISQGWTPESVVLFNGTSIYLNSDDGQSPVTPINGVLASDDSAGGSEGLNSTSAGPSGSNTGSSPNPSSSGTKSSSSLGSTGTGTSSESNGALSSFATSTGAISCLAGLLVAALFI